MSGALNKRKAAAALEQGRLLLQAKRFARALEVLEPVVASRALPGPEAATFYAEALEGLGRRSEARRFLEEALSEYQDSALLSVRLGALLIHDGESVRGVELMAKGRQAHRRDPVFLTNYAHGLLRAGRLGEAEAALAAAMLTGGGEDTRLVLALTRCQRGDYAGAESIVVQLGTQTKDEAVRHAARALEADCRLMMGDARGALDRFRALDREGHLEPTSFPHAALAAQLAGDETLATSFMSRRRGDSAAEDHLLFAQVYLSRQRPAEALAELDLADARPGERLPGYEYERAVSRARALRLLGRSLEALPLIGAAVRMSEAGLSPLGARAHLEQGHLAAEQGDFELADGAFTRATELDPNDSEARLARESSKRKTAWKAELKASADARIEAARAEAEAIKRRFLAREGELEAMRRELERLKSVSAEAQARAAEEAQARKRVEAAQAERVREELVERERDADEKARAVIDEALGPAAARCPDALRRMVLVAEQTYQKALYAQLPAAAVAVLFSGALERSLFMLVVQPFDAWLERTGRREAFLKGAVRERRGRRVEYFDRFVEAFDRSLEARAPALGELARALARRREAPLAAFLDFLTSQLELDDAFLSSLGAFVQSAKERLRDPVAHGQAIDLSWDELKAFREVFLLHFEGGAGVLARLLGAR